MKEGHLHSYKHWDKFARNLQLELAKQPLERTQKKSLLDLSKKEFDRLIETSPDIPDNVVTLFALKFKRKSELVKPDLYDIMPTQVYEMEDLPLITNDSKQEIINKFKENNGRYPNEEEIQDILDEV